MLNASLLLFPAVSLGSFLSNSAYKVKIMSASENKVLLKVEEVLRANLDFDAVSKALKGREIPLTTSAQSEGPQRGLQDEILAGRDLLIPGAQLVATHESYSSPGINTSQWSFASIKESSAFQGRRFFPKIDLSYSTRSRSQMEISYPEKIHWIFSLLIPAPAPSKDKAKMKQNTLSLIDPLEIELRVKDPQGGIQTSRVTLAPGTRSYALPIGYKMNGLHEIFWKIRSPKSLVAYGPSLSYLIPPFEMGNTEDIQGTQGTQGLRYDPPSAPSYPGLFKKVTLRVEGVKESP